MKNLESPVSISNLEEISALKELIAVIVDYYCFKNNDFQNDNNSEDEEDEAWKKLKKEEVDNSDDIIPVEINSLIEKTFQTQLRKFI